MHARIFFVYIHTFPSISFPSVALAHLVQSILPVRRFPSKFTQISNAIASTACPKPASTSLNQSILSIMTAQRAENLVFRASAQSSLPQTTAYPCRPVDPRQNGCLLPFTPCSQYSLTTPCVRPFCPVHPRPSRSSLPAPLRASISYPERPHTPFSQSCLAKIKQACTSLKIRYRAHLPSTLDLTKTCKPYFSDSILPRKSKHRHSQ